MATRGTNQAKPSGAWVPALPSLEQNRILQEIFLGFLLILLLLLLLGHHTQVYQVSCAPPRPGARPARQGRGEDGERHLPSRVKCKGAQRGQSPGRRPRRTG